MCACIRLYLHMHSCPLLPPLPNSLSILAILLFIYLPHNLPRSPSLSAVIIRGRQSSLTLALFIDDSVTTAYRSVRCVCVWVCVGGCRAVCVISMCILFSVYEYVCMCFCVRVCMSLSDIFFHVFVCVRLTVAILVATWSAVVNTTIARCCAVSRPTVHSYNALASCNAIPTRLK